MISKIHLFLGICLIYAFVFQVEGDEEKKKLKLVLDKLEKVNDAEHIVKTELTFDKDEGDDLVKVNGNVELSVDLDNDYKLTFDILHAKEQEGEYSMVMRTPLKGVCEVMQNQYKNMFYDTLKEHCNSPDPDKCPVTKDIFTVENYPLDSSKFQNYLRPGFYHIVGTLQHNDQEVLQYRVEAHTEEE